MEPDSDRIHVDPKAAKKARAAVPAAAIVSLITECCPRLLLFPTNHAAPVTSAGTLARIRHQHF
jgi:hypothetical protein